MRAELYQKHLSLSYTEVNPGHKGRVSAGGRMNSKFGKAGAANLKRRSGFKDAGVRRSQKPNFEFILV